MLSNTIKRYSNNERIVNVEVKCTAQNCNWSLPQPASSAPSEQSFHPSHTLEFEMHDPFEHPYTQSMVEVNWWYFSKRNALHGNKLFYITYYTERSTKFCPCKIYYFIFDLLLLYDYSVLSNCYFFCQVYTTDILFSPVYTTPFLNVLMYFGISHNYGAEHKRSNTSLGSKPQHTSILCKKGCYTLHITLI